jgi:hypothetical protein
VSSMLLLLRLWRNTEEEKNSEKRVVYEMW